MAMTAMEDYFTQIVEGRIVACHKMIQVARMILYNLHHPGKYHFDEKIANRHIEFIETFCKLPSGKRNTPLKLELFQKARLQAIFGFVDDQGHRQYQEVLIVEGRKNGKTTETAAVELDLLVNDGEFAPQIYNVATAKDQANLGFNACHKMIKQSPDLAKHIQKRTSDLYFEYNEGFIKAMASNTNTLDGLDVHGATVDELAAIKNRDLYDLVRQAITARVQPLIFVISTNGFIREGIFDAQYDYATKVLDGTIEDEHFLPFIYELDDISEWTDEKCWIKANPGLGTIKSIEKLRSSVEKAKNDITYKPTVLVKDFNIKQTGISSWLRWEDLYNNAKLPDYKWKYGIGGIDAAETTDLAAAKLLVMKPGDPHIYVKSMYWMPQKTIDEYENSGKRQGRDNVPYKLWVEQGYLRTVQSHKVEKKVFLEWFKEQQEEEDIYIKWIGYDSWHMDDSILEEFEMEFGSDAMVRVNQGSKTLSDPMKEMKADLKEKLIVYDDNPIDKWCLANVAIRTDINANIQPVKTDDPRRRIDGAMALIDAYVVFRDNKEEFINDI